MAMDVLALGGPNPLGAQPILLTEEGDCAQ